jgi:hypothetical protein
LEGSIVSQDRLEILATIKYPDDQDLGGLHDEGDRHSPAKTDGSQSRQNVFARSAKVWKVPERAQLVKNGVGAKR